MLRQQSLVIMAHQIMGDYCGEGENMKKAKFHYDAAVRQDKNRHGSILESLRSLENGTSFEALDNFCIGRGL